MDEVARKGIQDTSYLADLFSVTAEELGIDSVIIEKDFWVCWILRRLFMSSSIAEQVIFKGGTSLSKCFGLINRFSEDIDLILDYRALGNSLDPYGNYSRSKQNRINKVILNQAHDYLRNVFVPALRESMQQQIPDEPWELELDSVEPEKIWFFYPSVVANELSYIRKAILLEVGPHAARVPHQKYHISPLASQVVPDQFNAPRVEVTAIEPWRSFWEKVTILHENAHRPVESPMPNAYSRHYYDVVMMSGNKNVFRESLNRLSLLDDVIAHKNRFYYRGWSHFDTARPPTLCLLPQHDVHQRQLRQDYQAMQSMFTGEAPVWDVVLDELAQLEQKINTGR